MFRGAFVCCSTDLGQEYARKLEQLRREEELIQEEELEAEAFADPPEPVAHKVRVQLLPHTLNSKPYCPDTIPSARPVRQPGRKPAYGLFMVVKGPGRCHQRQASCLVPIHYCPDTFTTPS